MFRRRALIGCLMVIALVAPGCSSGGSSNAANNAGTGQASRSGAGNSTGAGSGQASGSGSGGSSGQISASLSGHHYFREVDDHANPAGTVIDTARIDWTATISGSLAGLKNGTVV